MTTIKILLLLVTIFPTVSIAQDFINGGLEDEIEGFSSLPSPWVAVDYLDINCEADAAGTTPDLINSTQPGDAVNGVLGTPHSGSTCVAGSYGGTPGGTNFHEGIQQQVGGFTIGQEYILKFYQSVIKTQYCSDTSGTWMVIMDNNIVGSPEASISHEPYNSVSNAWDMRSVSFTASQEAYIFKFLPNDDDDNQTAIIGEEGGCLYMGIDSISIDLAQENSILENNFGGELSLYPNPTAGDFVIDLGQTYESVKVTITDLSGRLIQSNTLSNQKVIDLSIEESAGVYLLAVETATKKANLKLVKE